MSLTVKAKPGAVHKKIKAQHHRHSKHYVKTYWPYMPILAIVAIALVINHYWHTTSMQTNLTSYTYFDVLESSLAVAALVIFLLRHAFAWHKVLVKGEAFAAKHPMLDIGLVFIASSGLLLAHHGINLI